jgi:hypothetical protein
MNNTTTRISTNISHDNILKAIVLAAIAWYIYYRRRSWKSGTERSVQKILATTGVENISPNHESYSHQSLESLPYPVRNYLKQVLFLIDDEDCGKDYMLHYPLSVIKSLTLKQEGFIRSKGKWVPFKAKQVTSASPTNPGFVWEGTIRVIPEFLFLFPWSINIRDSYIEGVADINVGVTKVFPVVDLHDISDLNNAELIRWLAEIVLYPTALLHEKGLGLQWIECHHESSSLKSYVDSAKAKFTDPASGNIAEVEFRFNRQGLISSIYGIRSRLVGTERKEVMTPWEFHVNDYVVQDGMLVPSQLEYGWWTEDKLDIIFKCRNKEFEYKYYK